MLTINAGLGTLTERPRDRFVEYTDRDDYWLKFFGLLAIRPFTFAAISVPASQFDPIYPLRPLRDSDAPILEFEFEQPVGRETRKIACDSQIAHGSQRLQRTLQNPGPRTDLRRAPWRQGQRPA